MSNLIVIVPYQRRHLTQEIKLRGGIFDSTTKTWTLADNQDNRVLADLIQKPLAGPTPEERAQNNANLAVALLNALRYRKYRLVESGNRIVLESDPIEG